MMSIQAKLIVAFVWCIIAFEATSFLYLYAPLLFLEVKYKLIQNLPLFILKVPLFIAIVSVLCISYYKSIFCPPGYSSYHIVYPPNSEHALP
jgi:hypothetical protein